MSKRNFKKAKPDRFVAIYHWVMRTEAWRELTPVERCVYTELLSRYAGPGSNNGCIPYSYLELATALHCSKQTAMRALSRLQELGFIVLAKPGAFNVKVRHASEWRLTEFKCDVTGAPATKAFAQWKKSEHGSTRKPHRVSTRNRTGFDTEPVTKENQPYGSTRKPVARSHGSTRKPLLVYQGDGASQSTPSKDIPDPTEDRLASVAPQTQARQPAGHSTAPSKAVLPQVSAALLATPIVRKAARRG